MKGRGHDGGFAVHRVIVRAGKAIRAVVLLLAPAMAACTGQVVSTGAGGGDPSGGGAGGADEVVPVTDSCLDLRPRRIVRLSDRQYANAVRDVVGLPDATIDVSTAGASPRLFLEDLESQSVSASLAQQYQATGESMAGLVDAQAIQFDCESVAPGADPCVQTWIRDLLARAFRRPVSAADVQDMTLVYDAGVGDGAYQGATLVVDAVVQSPSFLYRTELGTAGSDGTWKLTDHELAAQLSFWLLESIPDNDLRNAALAGTLSSPDGLGTEVRRLLGLPRVKNNLSTSFLRWFQATDLSDASKDATLFPDFARARPALTESIRMGVDEILWSGGDIMQMFTTPSIYVSDEIAGIFGVPPQGPGMKKVQAPDGQRAGILTHPAVLASRALSTGIDTRPVTRGRFVRESILCQSIPPPPPGAQSAIEGADKMTHREFAAARAAAPACGSCHALLDPIGLLLDRYDPVGAYHDAEYTLAGKAIDVATPVEIGSTDFDGVYQSPIEFAAKLAESDVTGRCLTSHMLGLAVAKEYPADGCATDALVKAFRGGHELEPLLVQIALSPQFGVRAP